MEQTLIGRGTRSTAQYKKFDDGQQTLSVHEVIDPTNFRLTRFYGRPEMLWRNGGSNPTIGLTATWRVTAKRKPLTQVDQFRVLMNTRG